MVHPAAAQVTACPVRWCWSRSTQSRYACGNRTAAATENRGCPGGVAARRQRDAAAPLDYQVLIYPVIDPLAAAESYAELG